MRVVSGVAARWRRVDSWLRISLQSDGSSSFLVCFFLRRGVLGCGVSLLLLFSRWEEIWETRSVAIVVWSFGEDEDEGVAFSSFRLWSPIVMIFFLLSYRCSGEICYVIERLNNVQSLSSRWLMRDAAPRAEVLLSAHQVGPRSAQLCLGIRKVKR